MKQIVSYVGRKNNILKEMSDGEKATLHRVLVIMLKDLMVICEKIGVELVLVGGSALGAVRHKGFIPWDDDIDVGMTRQDWEKFKKGCDKYLGDRYVIESSNYNNKDTKYLQQRVYWKETEYILAEEINLPYNNGIFIDILIIDEVSDNQIVRSIDGFIADSMRIVAMSMLNYKFPNPLIIEIMNSTLFTRIYYTLRRTIGFLFSWCSHRRWCDMYDNFVSRHNGENATYTTVATGQKRYKGEILPKDIWFPYREGEFCGLKVKLPHDTDGYLSEIYGKNYMQIPPKEQRVSHPIVRLKFPDSVESVK